jgi:hypothetical protein
VPDDIEQRQSRAAGALGAAFQLRDIASHHVQMARKDRPAHMRSLARVARIRSPDSGFAVAVFILPTCRIVIFAYSESLKMPSACMSFAV